MLGAFDTGPHLTGWCVGDGSQIPEVGVWEFTEEGDDYGALGCQLLRKMTAFHAEYAPDEVCYEAPLHIVKKAGRPGRTDTLPFLRRRYGMDFLIETFFVNKGATVRQIDLRWIKKELTGDVYGDKKDMVAVARRIGLALPPGDGAKDATDAFGAWLVRLREIDPKASAHWDEIVRGQLGALL